MLLYAEEGRAIGGDNGHISPEQIAAQRALLRAERRWGHADAVSGEAPDVAADQPTEPERTDTFGRTRRLAASAAIALVLVIGIFILHSPEFELAHLEVRGLHQLTASEVWLDLGYAPGTYTWQVRPWVVSRRLARNPLIAKAELHYMWPNGIAIAVTERRPVALVATTSGDWEVSNSGRLLRGVSAPPQGQLVLPPGGTTATMQSAGAAIGLPASAYPLRPPGRPQISGVAENLPIIVGVALRYPVAGKRVSLRQLAQALEVARSMGASGETVASELLLEPTGIYLVTTGGIPVDFGTGQSVVEKMGELLGILQDIQSEHLQVGAIDVSAPATPSLELLPGSPSMHLQGVLTGN